MHLLLDTHTFLWFVTDDPNLSSVAKALIEDPSDERWVSIATPWEMAIKMQLGKLMLTTPLLEFLNEYLSSNSIRVLPISLEHVAAVATLPRHHRDPFDRLLISQSMIENIGVVGADRTFDAYGIVRHW